MAASFGPWLGVPLDKREICAVEGCKNKGEPQTCPYDGRNHHHGCIHYDCAVADDSKHGLKFREGWGLVCEDHYRALRAALHTPKGPGLREPLPW